jgi:hypothetical protein
VALRVAGTIIGVPLVVAGKLFSATERVEAADRACPGSPGGRVGSLYVSSWCGKPPLRFPTSG